VPDLPWSLSENVLLLQHPAGVVRLGIECPIPGAFAIDRAGRRLFGAGDASPISGWVSPTYGLRLPALSLSVTWQAGLPLEIQSRWQIP
jgi:hypothetical protein